MWNDHDAVMTNFYFMKSPSRRWQEEREAKVKALIEQMGDKYVLAKPVGKLNDVK